MNKDELVQGLKLIRQGILSDDMQLVCNGYNMILHDNLQPIRKTNPIEEWVLDDLRSAVIETTEIANASTLPTPSTPTVDFNQKTVKELKEMLEQNGYTTNELKKKKSELVKMAEEVVGRQPEQEVSSVSCVQNGLTVVQVEFDPEEAARNAAMAKTKPTRNKINREQFQREDGDVRLDRRYKDSRPPDFQTQLKRMSKTTRQDGPQVITS
ncbi:MAG: hypothetical protein WC942_09275 [Clostridia bacterium]|jgi:hypothetical protein